MVEKKRADSRNDADFLSAYGGMQSFEKLSYGDYVGLVLNVSRVQSRHAYAVYQGSVAAKGGKVSASIFEGVTESEEEAEELAGSVNRAYEFAKAIAETGH